MARSFDDLIRHITEHFPLTPQNYPVLENATHNQKIEFAIRHGHLHMNKALGRIAAEIEAADHRGNGQLNTAAISEQVVKMLISTLFLAGVLGMTDKEIQLNIEDVFKHG